MRQEKSGLLQWIYGEKRGEKKSKRNGNRRSTTFLSYSIDLAKTVQRFYREWWDLDKNQQASGEGKKT